MILLLDIGNTRLKWMQYDTDRLVRGGCVAHRDSDLDAVLDHSWTALDAPQRVVAASVARAEVRAVLDAWTMNRWRTSVEFVVPTAAQAGVVNGYLRPERLGVDRWTALVAAHHRFQGAACVVDCGSALTIDAIDAEGRHLGGLIVPGLGTMHRSLTTGDIRLDAGTALQGGPTTLLGQDTAQAVGNGIHYCLAAFVDRVCRQIDSRIGAPCRRLLTGGDAERLRPLLEGDYRIEPDLVLEGLAVLVRSESRERAS